MRQNDLVREKLVVAALRKAATEAAGRCVRIGDRVTAMQSAWLLHFENNDGAECLRVEEPLAIAIKYLHEAQEQWQESVRQLEAEDHRRSQHQERVDP